MINEKTQKKQVSKITADMLSGLSDNMRGLFAFHYPEGLEMSTLIDLAKDSNIHRIVLQHVQKGGL